MMERRTSATPTGHPFVPRRGHERILVIEPEADARRVVLGLLKLGGYLPMGVEDARLGLEVAREFQPDLALLDVDACGTDVVQGLKRSVPTCGVVVTARYDLQPQVDEALHAGADDYLLKPLQSAELEMVLDRELRRRTRGAENWPAFEAPPEAVPELVGTSPQLAAVKAMVMKIAPSNASVLISGESGTGKELVAAALHRLSPRAGGPFVAVNCAALPETLLESELFGHERGAFTGAAARKEGRFELADGGTLFLDEIGEIPPSTQVKLLRVLQERSYERVGGVSTLTVDVRVVAATNSDLQRLVAQGSYRADLYYRLNVLSVQVPPLRQRRRDIPVLWSHFLAAFLREDGRPALRTSPEVTSTLLAYEWPGNVRELRNATQYAAVMCRGGVVGAEHLPPYLAGLSKNDDPFELRVPGMTMAQIEQSAILRTYQATGGNAQHTADILSLSIRKIRYRLKQYREAGLLPGR